MTDEKNFANFFDVHINEKSLNSTSLKKICLYACEHGINSIVATSMFTKHLKNNLQKFSPDKRNRPKITIITDLFGVKSDESRIFEIINAAENGADQVEFCFSKRFYIDKTLDETAKEIDNCIKVAKKYNVTPVITIPYDNIAKNKDLRNKFTQILYGKSDLLVSNNNGFMQNSKDVFDEVAHIKQICKEIGSNCQAKLYVENTAPEDVMKFFKANISVIGIESNSFPNILYEVESVFKKDDNS